MLLRDTSKTYNASSLLQNGSRGAVDLRYKEDAEARQITFTKRSKCLKKMAHELSVLCDAEVLLLWYDQSGKASAQLDDDSTIEKIIRKYQALGKEKQGKYKVDSLDFLKGQKHSLQANVVERTTVEHFVQMLDSKIEDVRRRIEVLQNKKCSDFQPVYEAPLNCSFADNMACSSSNVCATNILPSCIPYGLFCSQEMPNALCCATPRSVDPSHQLLCSDHQNPQLEYYDYLVFPSLNSISEEYLTGSMAESFSHTDILPSWSLLSSTCEDLDSNSLGVIPHEDTYLDSDMCSLSSLAPPHDTSAHFNEMDTRSIAFLPQENSSPDVQDFISCCRYDLLFGYLPPWSSLSLVAVGPTCEVVSGNDLAATPQARTSTGTVDYHDSCL